STLAPILLLPRARLDSHAAAAASQGKHLCPLSSLFCLLRLLFLLLFFFLFWSAVRRSRSGSGKLHLESLKALWSFRLPPLRLPLLSFSRFHAAFFVDGRGWSPRCPILSLFLSPSRFPSPLPFPRRLLPLLPL